MKWKWIDIPTSEHEKQSFANNLKQTHRNFHYMDITKKKGHKNGIKIIQKELSRSRHKMMTLRWFLFRQAWYSNQERILLKHCWGGIMTFLGLWVQAFFSLLVSLLCIKHRFTRKEMITIENRSHSTTRNFMIPREFKSRSLTTQTSP